MTLADDLDKCENGHSVLLLAQGWISASRRLCRTHFDDAHTPLLGLSAQGRSKLDGSRVCCGTYSRLALGESDGKRHYQTAPG